MLPLALTLGEPAGHRPRSCRDGLASAPRAELPPFYLIADGISSPTRRPAWARRSARSSRRMPRAIGRLRRALPVVGLDMRRPPSRAGRTDSSAPAAIASIRRAVADVLRRHSAAAVVTNPIAKNVLYDSGFADPGHTEFLGKLATEATGEARAARDDAVVAGASRSCRSPSICRCADVFAALTTELIVATGAHRRRDLAARFGIERPRLAVAASIRMPASRARWATRKARIIAPAIERAARPRASMRAGRCRPTRCSMRLRAPPTTRRCACITTRR